MSVRRQARVALLWEEGKGLDGGEGGRERKKERKKEGKERKKRKKKKEKETFSSMDKEGLEEKLSKHTD